jgi:hypothetical protein
MLMASDLLPSKHIASGLPASTSETHRARGPARWPKTAGTYHAGGALQGIVLADASL